MSSLRILHILISTILIALFMFAIDFSVDFRFHRMMTFIESKNNAVATYGDFQEEVKKHEFKIVGNDLKSYDGNVIIDEHVFIFNNRGMLFGILDYFKARRWAIDHLRVTDRWNTK